MPGEVGRPSLYTEQLGDEICTRLEAGESLNSICRSPHIPSHRTIRSWSKGEGSAEIVGDFPARYAAARLAGYMALAEDLLDIADDGRNDWIETHDPENPGYRLNGEHVARSRIRIDTRKWILAKMLPKIYGEKVQHTNEAGDGDPVTHVRVSFVKPGQD